MTMYQYCYTRGKQNGREARRARTWYFSSENPTNCNFTTGTAIGINNKMVTRILTSKLTNDRLMNMQQGHTTTIIIINCYCPQAGRPSEEKNEVSDQISKIATENKTRGPALIGWYLNARLQKTTDEEEKHIVGNHTFSREIANVTEMTEDMSENRQLLVNLCKEQNTIV